MKIQLILLTLAASLFLSPPLLAEPSADTLSDVQTPEMVQLYVNINTASAEKMADLLTGIGLMKAQAIIAYRDANGPFLSVEDLLLVTGIGTATLEKNRPALRLAD
ncbi:ComEA family DNA-binding protein [Reinekea sp.]|uniref:ComEA family DNA-binding protein n=1 Tax=Reinekea sp. TaxID=1970455 RepID=UPI002A7EEDD6|nr:helix-hairpin-helix domain-containing protein [Reinekea sp.]